MVCMMCMNTTETRSYGTNCFRCGPAGHVQTRNVSDKHYIRESGTETGRAASCRKRLKHEDKKQTNTQTNSVALSLQANYTD
jgi:hypothetical protein